MQIMTRLLAGIAALSLLAAFGCSKPEEPAPPPSPAAGGPRANASAPTGPAGMAQMPAPTKIKE